MTAIAAISTPKYTIIAADTIITDSGDSYDYTKKLHKLDSGMVIGVAGECGPVTRRMLVDPKWKAIESLDDFYKFVIVLANEVIEKEQFHSESELNPEELLVASPDGFMLVDNQGARTRGHSLKSTSGEDLQIKIAAAGSGKSFVYGYINGYVNSMSDKDKKTFFRGTQRVADLLRESINYCSKYHPGIGGEVDVEILKKVE
jgi:hypothetical protein